MGLVRTQSKGLVVAVPCSMHGEQFTALLPCIAVTSTNLPLLPLPLPPPLLLLLHRYLESVTSCSRKAQLGSCIAIGAGTSIGDDCHITRCVIGRGCVIGKGCNLRGCYLHVGHTVRHTACYTVCHTG
jgi:hypothetical protein